MDRGSNEIRREIALHSTLGIELSSYMKSTLDSIPCYQSLSRELNVLTGKHLAVFVDWQEPIVKELVSYGEIEQRLEFSKIDSVALNHRFKSLEFHNCDDESADEYVRCLDTLVFSQVTCEAQMALLSDLNETVDNLIGYFQAGASKNGEVASANALTFLGYLEDDLRQAYIATEDLNSNLLQMTNLQDELLSVAGPD